MQWLKTNFLKLSIHRQIQFGVLTVSCCVFLLVLGLITINSFILINLSYTDLITMLDEKDSQQIEGAQLYVDLQMMTIYDSMKDSVQYVRNLMNNLQRMPKFIIPINNNYNNTAINNINGSVCFNNTNNNICNFSECKSNCSVGYYIYNTTDNKNISSFLNIISNSMILINYSLNLRLYLMDDEQINKQWTLISNNLSTAFVFPNNLFNKNINFNENIKFYLNLNMSEKYFDNPSNDKFNVTKPVNFGQTIEKSPIVNIENSQENYIINSGLISNNTYIFTLSLNYSNSSVISRENINNSVNLNDLMILETDPIVLDSYIFKSTNIFKGIKVFVQNFQKNKEPKLLSPSYCKYFLYLNRIYKNDTVSKFTELDEENNITKISLNATNYNITKCFIYNDPNLNNSINDTFSYNGNDDYIKRRVKFAAISKSSSKKIYYKVFKNLSPDNYVYSLMNSNYFPNNQDYVYIFKDQTFIEQVNNNVYYKFIGVMIMILCFNFFFWYLLLLLIYALQFNVTTSLTKPINVLCKLVKSIGKEESEDDEENWNFIYSDDKDIKELFELCKHLINGGFNDCNSKIKDKGMDKYVLNNAYNNISNVKTNNLIIEEDMIEKHSNEHANSIFNYNKKEEYPINNDIKSEMINIDIQKDSKNSIPNVRESSISKKINLNEEDIGKNFKNQNEALIYNFIDKYQIDEETNSKLFDLFKNADLKIFNIE